MSARLEGKVVIVTGASRGLGAWCAEGFARDGALVVLAARSLGAAGEADTLSHVASRIEAHGGQAVPVVCDVANAASVRAVVNATLTAWGRIDVLMNNAIHYAPGDFSTVTEAGWARQFEVNVHGPFHAIRAVLPAMIEQGAGHIINVSSAAATKPSHYGATKRVIEAMTEGFALEQRANGVAVNALRPVAAIRTPGWTASRPAEILAARAHRVSPPDSYVEAAVLLARLGADACTGQALTDAQVIARFGAPSDLDRFREMNVPVWSDGL